MDLKSSLSKLAKNITEGASNVANTVVKTSTEMVEKSKVLSSIGSCKRDVKELYQSLGENLYKKGKDGLLVGEEFSETISKIDILYEEIAILQAKLEALSNDSTCNSCGKELDKGIKFCPSCGSKQEEIKEEPQEEPLEEENKEE